MANESHHNEVVDRPRVEGGTPTEPRASRARRPHASASRMTALAGLLVGVMLLAVGCAHTDVHAPIASARANPVQLELALDTMLRAPGPDSAESFLASLPQPIDSNARSVRNSYDPRVEDTVRTLVYDDLTITVYEVTTTGARFPIAVTLTAPGQTSTEGLRVGLDRQSVRRILGEPDVVIPQTGAWHYDVMEQDAAPYAIDVVLGAEVVNSVTWSAYLD